MHRERNGERNAADVDGRAPPQQQTPPSSPPADTGSEAKNPRDRVSFPSSSSSGPRPRPSCWGRIRIHRVGRLSSSRSRTGGGDGHETAAPAVRAVVSSSLIICAGDRGRGRRGKADAAAAGARSLLQRNDFYCDDCNTHRGKVMSIFKTQKLGQHYTIL